MSSVQDLISSLASVADKPLSDAERFQLLGAMDKARIALEPPPFALQKLCFSPITLAVTRIAVGIKLFDAFAANPAAAIAIEDLVGQVKGSKDLTVRVVRHLTASGILEEVSPGTYKSSPLGLMCSSTAPGSDAIIHFYNDCKVYGDLYAFISNHAYFTPSSAHDTPYQFTNQTSKLYFDFIASDPVRQRAFNTCMEMHSAYRPQDWHEIYPVNEKLQVGVDTPERVALVDIGGGTGNDIKTLHAKFPKLGRLVLQDLPAVISQIETSDLPMSITAQAHDMLQPQPVRKAKAYYMRTVLHDWPDQEAKVALRNVREAMAEDSVLLVNDNIMGDESLTLMDTSVDWTMMISFSSKERTEKEWIDLIESAGFQVVKVRRATKVGPQTVALFEAVRA